MPQDGSFPQKEAPKPQESFQESVEKKAAQTPETAPEQFSAPEVQQERPQEVQQEVPQVPVQEPVQPVAQTVAVNEDRLEKEVESILAEDLTEMFLALPESKQQAFRQKGEETTTKIRELLRSSKVNMKKIFHLIRDWLKMLPGVNKFYLEQEAKLKTDKILLVHEEEKRRAVDQL